MFKKTLLIVILIIIFPSVIGAILSGNSYDSEQTLISSGGTENISSTTYTSAIAISQLAIGMGSSATYDSSFGFFFASIGNEAPAWSQSIPDQEVWEDSPEALVDSQLNSSGNGYCLDPNYGTTLQFSITSENTGEVDCSINNSVALYFKPAANWNGVASCTVRCSDGTYVADYTFNIEVNNTNDPPTHTNPILVATDDPLNRTTANLTATNQSTSDPDEDTVYNIYDFRKSGTSIAVLNMPFDLNDSTTTKDYSTYENNGTINGATWASNGKIGGAYSFDGNTDKINIGDDNEYDFGTQSFSYGAWFKRTGDSPGDTYGGVIISKGSYGASIAGYSAFVSDSTDIISAQIRQANDAVYNVGGPVITDSIWVHVMVVRDATNQNFSIYVNGSYYNSTTESSVLDTSSTNNLTIGSLDNGGSRDREFYGLIDEVKIFNKALSTEQIKAIYEEEYANNVERTIVSDETTKDESWTVAVTPNDLIEDGETLISNAVIIQNTPPVISSAILSSTSGNNLTTDNLTLTATSSDADNDVITNITDWRLSGTSIAVLNMPFDTNETEAKDYSTYENNGTINGATWNNNGQIGGAYSFDTNTINLDSLITLTDGYTLTFWEKETNVTRREFPIGYTSSAGDFLDLRNHTHISIRQADSSYVSWTLVTTLENNTWHFITVKINNSKYELFVDGQSQGLQDRTSTFRVQNIGNGYTNNAFSFNGSIDEVKIFNKALSTEQINAIYEEESAGYHLRTLVSNETSKSDVWSVAVTPNDANSDGNTLISNSVTIVNAQPTITLISPANNTPILASDNRTPTFRWDGSDGDGDSLTYKIWIAENEAFTTINRSNTTSTEVFTLIADLDVDKPYWWRVQVSDGTTNVNSSTWNFTIQSYEAISLTTSSIDFGNVESGLTVETENDADPFIIENVGNININLTIKVNQSLWSAVALNTENFLFRVDEDEAGAYNVETSTTTWTNMTLSNQDLIKEFDFHTAYDSAQIDINLTADLKESPGAKTTGVIITTS
jgi:hypothetical protein